MLSVVQKRFFLNLERKTILLMKRRLLPITISSKQKTKTYCAGGRHYSKSISQNVFRNLNRKATKILEVLKSKNDTCGRIESQFFTM